jgi:class 3 adenylate cyclase
LPQLKTVLSNARLCAEAKPGQVLLAQVHTPGAGWP